MMPVPPRARHRKVDRFWKLSDAHDDDEEEEKKTIQHKANNNNNTIKKNECYLQLAGHVYFSNIASVLLLLAIAF